MATGGDPRYLLQAPKGRQGRDVSRNGVGRVSALGVPPHRRSAGAVYALCMRVKACESEGRVLPRASVAWMSCGRVCGARVFNRVLTPCAAVVGWTRELVSPARRRPARRPCPPRRPFAQLRSSCRTGGRRWPVGRVERQCDRVIEEYWWPPMACRKSRRVGRVGESDRVIE
jgi:hypothetical protein